jgi:hypothetical protein
MGGRSALARSTSWPNRNDVTCFSVQPFVPSGGGIHITPAAPSLLLGPMPVTGTDLPARSRRAAEASSEEVESRKAVGPSTPGLYSSRICGLKW